MANGVNKAIIVGNCVRDPEVRTFASGGRVVSLTVATSERWKDKATGEQKERSEFHRVSIMNDGLGKIAEQYLRKGSTVYIEGQLETRKWQDQSGADKYTTEIVLRPFRGELTLLGGKSDGQRKDDDDRGGHAGNAGSGYGAGGHAMDDEIPFAASVL